MGVLGLALLLAKTSITRGDEKDKFFQLGTLDSSLATQYLAGRAGFSVVDAPVVQTYLDAKTPLGVFYGWSNARVNEKDVSELDLGWSSPEIGDKNFGVSFNVEGYTFPHTKKNWSQWDLETGANVYTKKLPLDFNLYSAANFAGGDISGIFKLSAKKDFEVGKSKFSLEEYLVYSDHYYSDHSGFSHAAIKGELSKPVSSNLDVYAKFVFQKRLKDFGGKVNDEAVGGVGLRYKFP